jgi:hypothetical protein
MRKRGGQADKSGNVGKGVTNIRTLRARRTIGVRSGSGSAGCSRRLIAKRTT